MFAGISEKITNRLIEKEIIDCCDRNIYAFGMGQLLTILLNVITIIFIGIILGQFWQSLLLVMSFVFLRSYAGGYHASTPIKCYLLTLSIITISLSVMKYIEINVFVCLGLLIISGVVILIFSPVESKNKPLDTLEFVTYRKRAIIVWGIEFVCGIVSALAGCRTVTLCIALAHVILVFSQIVAKVEYRET